MDYTRIIDDSGRFNYMKNQYGKQIQTQDIVKIDNNFTIKLNSKYDLQLFGFSMIGDVLNGIIEMLVSIVRYTISYIISLLSNILDIIGMFFVNYPGE